MAFSTGVLFINCLFLFGNNYHHYYHLPVNPCFFFLFFLQALFLLIIIIISFSHFFLSSHFCSFSVKCFICLPLILILSSISSPSTSLTFYSPTERFGRCRGEPCLCLSLHSYIRRWTFLVRSLSWMIFGMFSWYFTLICKTSHDDVLHTRMVSLAIVLFELPPIWCLFWQIHIRSLTWIPFEIFLWYFTEMYKTGHNHVLRIRVSAFAFLLSELFSMML